MRRAPPCAATFSQVVLLVPEEYPRLFAAAKPAPPIVIRRQRGFAKREKIADRARGIFRRLRQHHRAIAAGASGRESAVVAAGRRE